MNFCLVAKGVALLQPPHWPIKKISQTFLICIKKSGLGWGTNLGFLGDGANQITPLKFKQSMYSLASLVSLTNGEERMCLIKQKGT